MKSAFSTERLVALLKCLMAAYLITGALLMLVAGLLYKFSIGENVVDISIIVIYCISSLLSGLFFSKSAASHRFIWGMLAGAAYFVIICAVSAVADPDFMPVSNACITTLLICLGSGMLGGMLG
ncbi:MAG: TIGR04086 family membrane protein [Lachnospiraceae bacterium]|nr:TIGR04086 family membrane protein [Lachnospiraceae bacterium]